VNPPLPEMKMGSENAERGRDDAGRSRTTSKAGLSRDLGDVADVLSIDQDGPASDVVQPEQQPPDRALAAA